MKPVIVITHEFFPVRGGIAVFVEELAKAMQESSIDLEVWCPDHALLRQRPFSFPVLGIPVEPSQGLKSRGQLADYLKANVERWRRNRVLLPEPGPIRTFMEASRWGLPVPEAFDVILHGNEIPRLSSSSEDRELFHGLLKKAQSIVVVSTYGQSLLKKLFPDLASRLRVINPGLRSDLKRIETHLRSPSDRLRVLTVARVVPVKGHHVLIRALGRLDPELRRRLEYRVVGPVAFPPYLWFLKGLASLCKVRMTWQGSLDGDRLAQEYQQADLFALTSVPFFGRSEAFGLVYLEAGFFGLPAIGHRIGGVSDAVVEGETGFLSEPNDYETLSQNILKLVNDASLRKEMGKRACERAQTFTWKRFVLEVYSTAADLPAQKREASKE